MPSTLEYSTLAQRRPPRWRRIVVLSMAVCAAALGYAYRDEIILECRWLYYQQKWANCVIPAEHVVCDTDSLITLAKQNDGTIITSIRSDLLSRDLKFPDFDADARATLFLHELTSTKGNRRIVCINVQHFDFAYSDHTSRNVALIVNILETGWTAPKKWPITSHWYFDCPASVRLRLFAAQVDPADASHLSFRYEWGGPSGIAGTIDAYLQDDDTIRFAPDRGAGDGPNPFDGWKPILAPSSRPETRAIKR